MKIVRRAAKKPHKHAAERVAFEYTKFDTTKVTLEVCKCGLARWIERDDPKEKHTCWGRWENIEKMSADQATSINKIIRIHKTYKPSLGELIWELAVYMTAVDDEIDRRTREVQS